MCSSRAASHPAMASCERYVTTVDSSARHQAGNRQGGASHAHPSHSLPPSQCRPWRAAHTLPLCDGPRVDEALGRQWLQRHDVMSCSIRAMRLEAFFVYGCEMGRTCGLPKLPRARPHYKTGRTGVRHCRSLVSSISTRCVRQRYGMTASARAALWCAWVCFVRVCGILKDTALNSTDQAARR